MHSLLSKLENHKNSDELGSIISSYFGQDLIQGLKNFGFGVNAYPQSTSYQVYQQFRNLIEAQMKTDKDVERFKRYDNEIKLLNEIFADFYDLKEFNIVREIPDKEKLLSYIIIIEILLRNLQKKKVSNNTVSIEEIDFENQALITKDIPLSKFLDLGDAIIEWGSIVVKSFIFYGFLYKDSTFITTPFDHIYDSDSIGNSFLHLELVAKRNHIFIAYDDWRFGDYIIRKQDDNTISILPLNASDFIDEKIDIIRHESHRKCFLLNAYSHLHGFQIKQDNPKQLPPIGFLDQIELISYLGCLEYFASDNINYIINSISVACWIRAYSVIRIKNIEFMESVHATNSHQPDRYLLIRRSDEWIDDFVKNGINDKDARYIFQKLIFKKSSVDWIDNPFISIQEQILTIPSVASNIQIPLALISLATKENLNLQFKGYSFENRIMSDLNKANIIGVTVNKNNYQCDLAFIIDDDLFLCECKHKAQPITRYRQYEFYQRDIPTDIDQADRIFDYYSQHYNYIVQELEKKQVFMGKKWKPRRIYKFLIYSCRLSKNLYAKNEIIVTDYVIFTNILAKRMCIIWRGTEPTYIMPPKMKGVYDGRITSRKFMNSVNKQWQIEFQHENLDILDQVNQINKLSLHVNIIKKKIDDFGIHE